MWLKLGNEYLNLNNVADVIFLADDDGTLTATAATVAGSVKHYKGAEAEYLRDALNLLTAGPVPKEINSAPA